MMVCNGAVIFKDIDGKTVVLNSADLLDYLLANLTSVYGMDLLTITELRNQYLRRNGPVKMTPETVREIFSREAV